jgi:nicotinamide phosphoribosyltransferase
MKRKNEILAVDYYKATHWMLYPKGTTEVNSYAESRGGQFMETVFFGLQPELNKLEGVFVEQWMIEEADELFKAGFAQNYFNRAGWQYIVDTYGGKLPIEIKALAEGTVIPTKNALFTIRNTDPNCAWLTNYLESRLLRAVWYPTTVASLSYAIKQEIQKHCDLTGSTLSPFHLNDFGARGVSSSESAEVGGAGHLVNFMGTDTVEAVKFIMDQYNAGVVGYSVMASEHSTTTIYKKQGELEAFARFLAECPDEAILSIVIDSYDDENAVKNLLGGVLKDVILAREGKVVFRPDSGDVYTKPVEVVQWLWEIFGGTINEKGYKVLNPKVGALQGDGIDVNSIKVILQNLTDAGFATECLIFGCGGGLLQQVNRDTLKFALKCSYAKINGEDVNVYKDPVTDTGKTSKKGILGVEKLEDVTYVTHEEGYFPESATDLLQTVFLNGEVTKRFTFDEVRANANA